MKHGGKTRPIRGPRGEAAPGSIAEAHCLRLGGIDQWVMTRGASLPNPPLIILHGGPGGSATPFFRRFNAPIEHAFTVDYWEPDPARWVASRWARNASSRSTQSSSAETRSASGRISLSSIAICARWKST
jgi:hypothetical protein